MTATDKPEFADEWLGHRIIERIIDAGLVRTDDGSVFIWSSTAAAELGRFALELTGDSKMKLYIAGPMRGIESFNFPAFDRARDWLVENGYTPVSPADLDRSVGIDEKTEQLPAGFLQFSLLRDASALSSCDGLVLLEGWENSTGCRFEVAAAMFLGLDVFVFDGDSIRNVDISMAATAI